MEKRVNIRIEHINHSKCRDEFLQRVKKNAALKAEAKKNGTTVQLKRQPAGPKAAHFVSSKHNAPLLVTPLRYEGINTCLFSSIGIKRTCDLLFGNK